MSQWYWCSKILQTKVSIPAKLLFVAGQLLAPCLHNSNVSAFSKHVFLLVKAYVARYGGEDGVVATHSDIRPWMEKRSPLPDNDVPWNNILI